MATTAEYEVIAADPTTGILLFDQRVPATGPQQAIQLTHVHRWIHDHAAQIRARGIPVSRVRVLARLAPSGYASEVVPYLFHVPFQPGRQLTSEQLTTLRRNEQYVQMATFRTTTATEALPVPAPSSSAMRATSTTSAAPAKSSSNLLLYGVGALAVLAFLAK